jgi:hypothetical protein
MSILSIDDGKLKRETGSSGKQLRKDISTPALLHRLSKQAHATCRWAIGMIGALLFYSLSLLMPKHNSSASSYLYRVH